MTQPSCGSRWVTTYYNVLIGAVAVELWGLLPGILILIACMLAAGLIDWFREWAGG